MTWMIHTGPFPIVAPSYDGEMWLWRLTNSSHFTALVVKFRRSVLDADGDALLPAVAVARTGRGRSEIERCLRWEEPPREIEFVDPNGEPSYWSGVPSTGTV